MHAAKSTEKSNLNNSVRYKNKKLIKCISEKFLEEYAIKISTQKPIKSKSPNRNKNKRTQKTSLASSLVKTTASQSQISNISTCSNTSNNTKKQMVHRHRNKPSMLISNTKASTNSLKFSSYSSVMNINNNSCQKINVAKRKMLHNINNSTFVEIDEEINQSLLNEQKNKMNRSVSQNSFNEKSSLYKDIPIYKTKHLKDLNKSSCNISTQNAHSNSQSNNILYYKKQVGLNSSMDNALNRKPITNNIKVNALTCKIQKKKDISQVIEDPEEMHFAFVELCQNQKQMYIKLQKRFNNFSLDEDVL